MYKLVIAGIILALVFISGCTSNSVTNTDTEDYKLIDIGNGVLYNSACSYQPVALAVSHYIIEHPEIRVVSFSPASNNQFCGYIIIVEKRSE